MSNQNQIANFLDNIVLCSATIATLANAECSCEPKNEPVTQKTSSSPNIQNRPPNDDLEKDIPTPEYEAFINKITDSPYKNEVEDLFKDIELKKEFYKILNIQIVKNILNSQVERPSPRRDDWTCNNNYISTLCGHGENFILIKDTDNNHAYMRFFTNKSNDTDPGVFICFTKESSGKWKSVISRYLQLDDFKRLNDHFNSLFSSGATNKFQVSRKLLEKIDNFEGILSSKTVSKGKWGCNIDGLYNDQGQKAELNNTKDDIVWV